MRLISLFIIMLLASCATTQGNKTGSNNKKSNKASLTYDDLTEAEKVNYRLGIEYIQKSEFDAAEVKLMEVIASRPNFPSAYEALGNLQEQRGKKSDAITLYSKAFSVNPHYAAAYSNFARIQCINGNAAPIEQAAAQASGTIRAGIYAGAAACALNGNNTAQGMSYADQAIAADSQYAESYFYKAYAYSEMNKSSEVFSTLDIYHDLNGFTPYSARLGLKVATVASSQANINKYKDILDRQFGGN